MDRRAKETFKFISPTSEITNSSLSPLIIKWDLLLLQSSEVRMQLIKYTKYFLLNDPNIFGILLNSYDGAGNTIPYYYIPQGPA
jgi:hypothetical protein